jgi:hypothetical protein
VPTAPPFNFHAYVGLAPPLVGVALNTTVLAGQMLVLMLGTIAILTGKLLPETVLIILFEDATDGLAQILLEVTTQRTLSLFAATALYVGVLPPTFAPLYFH